jgi:hypothetical protein
MIDFDPASLLAIDELLLSPETGIEGPLSIFVNTRVLAVDFSRILSLPFDMFSRLERLTISIQKHSDVKRGQLSSLVHLKELELNNTNREPYYSLLFKNSFFPQIFFKWKINI